MAGAFSAVEFSTAFDIGDDAPVRAGGIESASVTAQTILVALGGSAGVGPRALRLVLNDIATEMGVPGGRDATPERAAQRILAHLQGVAAPAGVQSLERTLQQIVVALDGDAGASVEDNLAKWLEILA